MTDTCIIDVSDSTGPLQHYVVSWIDVFMPLCAGELYGSLIVFAISDTLYAE